MKKIIALVAVLVIGLAGYIFAKNINSKVEKELKYALIDADMDDYIQYQSAIYDLLKRRVILNDVTYLFSNHVNTVAGGFPIVPQGIELKADKILIKPVSNSSDNELAFLSDFDLAFENLHYNSLQQLPNELMVFLKIVDTDNVHLNGEITAQLKPSQPSFLDLRVEDKALFNNRLKIESDYINPLLDFMQAIQKQDDVRQLNAALENLQKLRISNIYYEVENHLSNEIQQRNFNLSEFNAPGEQLSLTDYYDNVVQDLEKSLTDDGVPAKQAEAYGQAFEKFAVNNGTLKIYTELPKSKKVDDFFPSRSQTFNDLIDNLSIKVSN